MSVVKLRVAVDVFVRDADLGYVMFIARHVYCSCYGASAKFQLGNAEVSK